MHYVTVVQPAVSVGCYYVLMMSVDINNIAILNICGVDYDCIIFGISKKILICVKKVDLCKIKDFNFFLSFYKMSHYQDLCFFLLHTFFYFQILYFAHSFVVAFQHTYFCFQWKKQQFVRWSNVTNLWHQWINELIKNSLWGTKKPHLWLP